MDTSNLSTTPSRVNGHGEKKPSIQEVIEWTESQMRKADMGEASARVRITSLQQMAEQVDDGEPGDAQWVADNIDRLRERWARRNKDAKSSTARTYASRASATIREYFRWAAAPDKYVPPSLRTSEKPRDGASGAKSKSKTRKAAQKDAPTEAPQEAAPAPATQPQQLQGKTRSYEVEGGEILFQLPADGVTFNDVKKFAVHLLTLATDFDISSPEQGQLFAMVVRGNRE